MKKMKLISLMVLVLCQFVQSLIQDFLVVGPQKFGVQETICIDLKKYVSNLIVTTEIVEHETNKQIASNSMVLEGFFNCLLLNIGRRGPYDPITARLIVSAIDGSDIKQILGTRNITFDNDKVKADDDIILISSNVRKKRSDKEVATKRLLRKNLTDTEFSQRFSSFADKSLDLEVPNQLPGTFQVFALPPSPNKDHRKCPQCLKKLTDDFLKLYCSSQLSAKIKLRGRNILYVLQDFSPQKNSTELRRIVSYTMKRRCECEFADHDESLLFMLVTPPRKFNLDSIQVVHLDESISLFPWNLAESYLSKIGPNLSCMDILTSE